MGTEPSRKLVEYLPALYREDPFIDPLLRAFDEVLISGYEGADGPVKGLEQSIGELPKIFDPQKAPQEFLAWLADWTAFTMRSDLDSEKQRDFLSEVISLYARRGTKKNLSKLLGIFLGEGVSPTIMEDDGTQFQLDDDLQIGVNTYLGGGSVPHFFRVRLALAETTKFMLDRVQDIAGSIIELEKPAHTHYRLDVIFPSMQIGYHCTIGVDTILGTEM